MLRHSRAFSGFTVMNVAEALEFYGKKLGLKADLNSANVLVLDIKDSQPVIIYESKTHFPSEHTVLNFPVEDVEQTVYKLMSRGVTFMKDKEELNTDELGVYRAEKSSDMAWFKDPSGNILALIEQVLEE